MHKSELPKGDQESLRSNHHGLLAMGLRCRLQRDMRARQILVQLLKQVRGYSTPGRRFIFFTPKPSEFERLKSDLQTSLKSTDRETPARAHIAIANHYLKDRKFTLALTHASEGYSLLRQVQPLPLSDLHNASRMLMDLHAICNQVNEALQVATESVGYAKQLYPNGDLELAKTMYGLSYLKASTGQDAEAEVLCLEVLQMIKSTRDKGFLADVHKTLGILSMNLGKNKAALKSLNESVALLEDIQNSENLPSALLALADLHWTEGRVQTVEDICRKTLAILRSTEGKNLDQLSLCLERLVSILMARADWKESGKFAKEKSALDERLRPDDLSIQAHNSYTLGLIAVSEDDPESAKTHLERALNLNKQTNVTLIQTLQLLCRTCVALNEMEQADKYAELMVVQVANVSNYPDLPGLYLDLGVVKEQQEKDSAALSAFLKCLELEKTNPSESSAHASLNIGQLYSKQNSFAQAKTYYSQGCEMILRNSPADSPEAALLLHNLGLIETSAESWEEAETHFSQSLELRLKLCDEKDDPVLESRQCLATVLVQRNKFAEAEVHLKKCLSLAHPEDADKIAAMLALVLEKQGKDLEAEALAKKHSAKSPTG